MNDLHIIIVHYNTYELTRNCLETIPAAVGKLDTRISVVNNASTDDSGQRLASQYPQHQFLQLTEPHGFSTANNLILRKSTSRYSLLLNSDTELPPESLQQAVSYLDDHEDIGLMGVQLNFPDGRIDPGSHRTIPTPESAFYKLLGISKLFPHHHRIARYNMTWLAPESIARVEAISGAFMLIRQSTIETVGLLDEAFTFYGEDLDYCHRCNQAGIPVLYHGGIRILHVKGGSTDHFSDWTINHFHDSMIIFFQKHFASRYPGWFNALVIRGITWRKNRFLRRARRRRQK